MLDTYQEKMVISRGARDEELAQMGVRTPDQQEEVRRLVGEQGQALISHYAFSITAFQQQGELTIYHDTGKGAISFGGPSEWGEWNEYGEFLELPDGRRYTFEGVPVDEGDEGSCSLGNV